MSCTIITWIRAVHHGEEVEEKWEVLCEIEPGERTILYDSNMTGQPGCDPFAYPDEAVELLPRGVYGPTRIMDGPDWLEYAGLDEHAFSKEVFQDLQDRIDPEDLPGYRRRRL